VEECLEIESVIGGCHLIAFYWLFGRLHYFFVNFAQFDPSGLLSVAALVEVKVLAGVPVLEIDVIG